MHMRNTRNAGIFIVKYYSYCVIKDVCEIKTECLGYSLR